LLLPTTKFESIFADHFTEQSSDCPKGTHCEFHMIWATDLDLHTEVSYEFNDEGYPKGKRHFHLNRKGTVSWRNRTCCTRCAGTGKPRAPGQGTTGWCSLPQEGRKKRGGEWKLPLPPAKVLGGGRLHQFLSFWQDGHR